MRTYKDINWHGVCLVRVKVTDEDIEDKREGCEGTICDGYCTVDLLNNQILMELKRDCGRKVIVHECLHCISYMAQMVGDEVMLQDAFANEIATYDISDFIEVVFTAYDNISAKMPKEKKDEKGSENKGIESKG